MLQVGQYNELEVIKIMDFGIYLGIDNHEILMPTKWVPRGTLIGDKLTVFIFRDSEDRLIATTIEPYTVANSFAFLDVKDTYSIGAFMDWGMDKDLLIPFSEQPSKLKPGYSYVVYVYVDEITNRIVGSAKLNKFIEQENIELQEGDIVDLLLYAKTDIGFNAIINNKYTGLIYQNEIYEDIRVGDKVKGFIKTIREDKKIDLSLQKSGFELVDDVKWKILNLLKQKNGFLALTDNSSPEEIKKQLQISKKAFKKAVGSLYRERLVKLTDTGIELIPTK